MQMGYFTNHPDHWLLWEKIRAFEFNEPGTRYTFAHKLAHENKWNLQYSLLVIEEYKKFILLCCISPTGASPSANIDKVWHLHLTYTKSYWIILCKQTLGFDLHHYPSRGGKEEEKRPLDWYNNTLVLYEQVFDQKPPSLFWSESETKMRIVNRTLYFPWKREWVFWLFFVIPTLAALAFFSVFPFDLDGSGFLLFYGVVLYLLVMLTIFQASNEANNIRAVVNEHFPADLTIFQMASFVMDRIEVLKTAVLDLVDKDVLIATKDGFTVHKNELWRASENPLSKYVAVVDENEITTMKKIEQQCFNEAEFKHEGFDHFLTSMEFEFKRPKLLIRLFYLVGLVRILQGFFNGYPVLFLVAEILIFICLMMILMDKLAPIKIAQDEAFRLYKEHIVMKKGRCSDLAVRYVSDGTIAFASVAGGPFLLPIFINYTIFTSRHTGGANGADGSGGADGGGGDGGGGSAGCGGGGCGGCGGGG